MYYISACNTVLHLIIHSCNRFSFFANVNICILFSRCVVVASIPMNGTTTESNFERVDSIATCRSEASNAAAVVGVYQNLSSLRIPNARRRMLPASLFALPLRVFGGSLATRLGISGIAVSRAVIGGGGLLYDDALAALAWLYGEDVSCGGMFPMPKFPGPKLFFNIDSAVDRLAPGAACERAPAVSGSSKLVATTITDISSPMFSSMSAPNITLASCPTIF
mmetsp:Transcript_9054/g.12453  ORF Transcript_9054/g.12453 Transcript_9054/m.12453 type:complete len:222 (-) Transcript_9054:1229-1894(-)